MLFIPSNFSTLKVAFVMVDFENIEDFEYLLGVYYGADEFELESPRILLIKGFTLPNL